MKMRAGMLLLCAALLFPRPLASAQPAPERPNILLIVTDDQRLETLSVMSRTERLFKDQGVWFKKAVATTPTCCPSRASILTGKYAHNHGVLWNDFVLANQNQTVQRYLSDAGYQTGIVGKYLNSWPVEEDPPHWDRWALNGFGYYDYPTNLDGTDYTEPRYQTDFVRDTALEFLEDFEEEDDPWFLYLAPNAPHTPYTAAPEYEDYKPPRWDGNPSVFEKDRRDKPEWVQDGSESLRRMKRIRRRQLRTLKSVDDMVKTVMRAIDSTDEDTLAIFMSDNGLLWGEHGLARKGHPYRASTTVPFMLRWPGHVSPGVSTEFAANIDVAPTILDAADLSVQMDGRSLLQPLDRNRILMEHWQVMPDWASLRNKRVQYIEYYDEEGELIFQELYEKDHWQLTNVLGDLDPSNDPAPGRLERLSDQLAEDRGCSGVSCP